MKLLFLCAALQDIFLFFPGGWDRGAVANVQCVNDSFLLAPLKYETVIIFENPGLSDQ